MSRSLFFREQALSAQIPKLKTINPQTLAAMLLLVIRTNAPDNCFCPFFQDTLTSQVNKRTLKLFLFLSAAPLYSGCGGPSKESRVATAIQSIMSNLIVGNLEILRGNGTSADAIPCGDSGSYTVSTSDPDYGLIDPSNPNPSVSATASIIYSDCQYKVCGEYVKLSGSSKTSMTLTAIATGVIEIRMTASEEIFSGVISGTQSFAYRMTGNANSTSFGEVRLFDADPAQPLILDGFTYEAEKLNPLADGC